MISVTMNKWSTKCPSSKFLIEINNRPIGFEKFRVSFFYMINRSASAFNQIVFRIRFDDLSVLHIVTILIHQACHVDKLVAYQGSLSNYQNLVEVIENVWFVGLAG